MKGTKHKVCITAWIIRKVFVVLPTIQDIQVKLVDSLVCMICILQAKSISND